MRWIRVLAVVASMTGCTGESTNGDSPDGDCTSHYALVANAPTRAALEQKLLRQHPSVKSLKVLDEDTADEKITVNLINARERLVASLDAWRKDDGTWTAQRWSQCID